MSNKSDMIFSGKAFKLERDGGVGILSFDLVGEKVNKLSHASAGELEQAIEKAKGAGLKALLIRSLKKNSFIVGADINLIRSLKSEEEARQASKTGQSIFAKVEDLGIPTLAAIDGPCMGGGTELVLSCRHRICSDSEKTVIALPEVKLGVLPGWGGTFRLPRLVGLPTALDMILSGKSIRADKAAKLGLVDIVVPSAIFADKSIEFARLLAEGRSLPGAKPRIVALQEKVLAGNFIGRKVLFAQARKGVMKATRGHYPAPLRALSVVEDTYGSSRSNAMEIEAKGFAALWATPESKNLVNLFFLVEDAKKNTGTSLTEEQVKKLPPIRELGVLGAGVMGGGIGAQAATFGVHTVVKDINYDAIAKGLAHARSIFDKDVKKRRIKANERDKRMALIRGQLDFTSFGALDTVIEAVVENIDIKRKVFAELETKVRPDAIIASNTSSLRLTDMASAFKDSSRFVGLHFFNPVEKMPLVEVITHAGTSEEVTARMVAFSKAIGKTPVVVKDGPGFLVNRLLMPWLNESAYCLLEGFQIGTLDRVAKAFGMPMGPCELLDEIGIDVACKVSHILEKDFGERAKAAKTSDMIVADNAKDLKKQQRLGRKSGLGFYLWDKPAGRRQEPDNESIDRILFEGKSRPAQPEFTDESLVRRMFYPMINEAAMALDEGICASPDQVDLAMIFGTGFPPFKGGLCRYADTVGLKKIEAELDRMSQIQGERMKPSKALRKFAANSKGTFY